MIGGRSIPDNYYQSRKRWNAANYKQLNLLVNPELLETFRTACEQNGNSMRKVLTEFMIAYAQAPPTTKKPKKGYNERGRRRKTVESIVSQLTAICEAEVQYMDNMPDNLKNSSRYTTAEQAVEMLNEAIELLMEAFK